MFESPSLRSSGDGGPSYELKFLLDEDRARQVESWARRLLIPDPHGDAALGGAYHTTSLYLDTPGLDVFHRAPWYRRRKHRVRRYGLGAVAFLERKTKRGARVRKRRAAVPLAELAALAGAEPDPAWPGHWFHRQLLRRGLRPVCLLSYDRTAFAGATAEGPLRVTLDRHLRGRLCDRWHLAAVDDGPDLLAGVVIVEFKFQGALPLAGKRLVEELRLASGPASKYRRFLRGTGLADVGGAHV